MKLVWISLSDLGRAREPIRDVGRQLGVVVAALIAGIAVQAVGTCRIRIVGVADDADLERSRQMLARRGFGGILRQRADHAAELASYATSIDTPEAPLGESFEWAKVHLDGLLVGTPGVGRCLVSGYAADRAGARFVTEDACRVAFAQLAAGDRTGPRDTLKFLSLSQDEGGRVVEECSTGGDARFGAGAVPMYLLLAARYAAWAGELDFLSRRWAAIRRSFVTGLAGRPWAMEQLEGICVIGEAANGLEAIEQVEHLDPDVILMDLNMPGMDGIGAIQRIMTTQPDQHIIVLPGFLDEERAVQAIRAGAQGCTDKNISPEELIRVIRDVYSGNPSFSSDLAWRILRASSGVEQPRRSKGKLSERELQILRLMTQGKLDEEIAQELVITEVTIRTHISRILAKLGLENRVQAALYGLHSGLVSISEISDVMEARWLWTGVESETHRPADHQSSKRTNIKH